MIERLTGKLLTRFLSKYFILPGESEDKSEGGGGVNSGSSSRSSNINSATKSSSSSPSKTQVAVWSGFLSFQHLQFRSSIVNDVFDKKGLPFELCFGMVDNVEVNVPWAQLRSLLSGSSSGGNKNESTAARSEAEIDIVLDGVYILINTRYEFYDDKLRESNRVERKKEMDAAMAYVANGSLPNSGASSSSSYFKSYIKNRLLSETFLNELFDNLTNRVQVHVRNLHVRVEDLESNPSNPCCYGFTLESLHLTSEEPEEDSDTLKRERSSSLEKVLARKVMQINQLSIYCNSMDDNNHNESQDGTSFANPANTYSPEVLPLQTMSDQPILLSRAMHSGIYRRRPRSFGNVNNTLRHTYLLRPTDATNVAVISKPNNEDNGGYKNAKVRAETNIAKFHLDIHSSTIGHLVTFHARLKHHKSLIRHRLHRPTVSVLSNPRQWWKYITRVVRKELRETGNVKRGGWSWLRWYDRMELRKHYMSLYERWLDYGVLGDDDGMIEANENEINHTSDHAASEASSTITTNAALTMKELNEMQAIENAVIDDELTVNDVLIFRTLVHSKRQKQQPYDTVDSTIAAVDSQYKLTRFLRRIVTSDDMDEEYTRLLAYLENKEKEDAEKLKQKTEEESKKQNGKLDELSAVISMETVINQCSLSLFSEHQQCCVFDIMINTFQSKLLVLENFDSIILSASLLDCVGSEHRPNEAPKAIFSRSIDIQNQTVINSCNAVGKSDAEATKDELHLPVDISGEKDSGNQWSQFDSPLLDVQLILQPPDENDVSLFLAIEKTHVLLCSGFDWPERCKEVLSVHSHHSTAANGAFWEDLSIAYMNSWETTKRAAVAKAKALGKQKKIDVNISIESPTVYISDEKTTLSIDLGNVHLTTEQLAGIVKPVQSYNYQNDVTPKKKNTTNLSGYKIYNADGNDSFNSRNTGYLLTPHKSKNGQSLLLTNNQNQFDSSLDSLDISNIFESPFDTSSLNGSLSAISIESDKRRRRGYSIGNSKLFSVNENQEATGGTPELELIKCFYDCYKLTLVGFSIFITDANTHQKTLFQSQACQAQVSKSIIPMDHSLCKVRFHATVGHLHLNISKESIHSIESLLKNMKHTPVKKHIASKKYIGSNIFPSIVIHESKDDESSVNSEEFLDAIDFETDADQWFKEHWTDDGSIFDASFTCEDTPRTSRRYRFPSISEVSSTDEQKVYLSADNLSKLDSQMSGDEDSFHSAISEQNLVKAIQEDIIRCECFCDPSLHCDGHMPKLITSHFAFYLAGEKDIDGLKSKIKSSFDMYSNWTKASDNDIKHRRYQKRKLKAQLLRLEGRFCLPIRFHLRILSNYQVLLILSDQPN